jgi:hypothetical protein
MYGEPFSILLAVVLKASITSILAFAIILKVLFHLKTNNNKKSFGYFNPKLSRGRN